MVADIKKIRGGWAQNQNYRKTDTVPQKTINFQIFYSNDILKIQPNVTHSNLYMSITGKVDIIICSKCFE